MTKPIDMSSFFAGVREASGFKPTKVCVKCEGRGVIPQDGKLVTCPDCEGTGKEKEA